MVKEHVIHWWIRDRVGLFLTETEKFHFDYLNKFNEKDIFDKITVCMAVDNASDELLDYLKNEFMSSINRDDINFVVYKNNPLSGEFYTYKNYVLSRLNDDVYLFYSHFKGARREGREPRFGEEKVWCTNLYQGCYDMEFVENNLPKVPMVGAHLEQKGVHWFDKWLWTGNRLMYEFKNPCFKTLYETSGGIYLDGSFHWINTIKMREYLKNKGVDSSEIMIDFDIPMRRTHLSEYYLCSLMDEKSCIAKYSELTIRDNIKKQ